MTFQTDFSSFGTNEFPRTYRISTGWCILFSLLSLLMGVLSLVGLWYFLISGGSHDRTSGLLVYICFTFSLLAVYLFASMFMSRIILWDDRIESREVFSAKTLAYAEILGRRTIEQRNAPSQLVIIPRETSRKKIKISQSTFNFDDTFRGWLSTLTDLDLEERNAAEEEILNNEQIGATPEERSRAFERGKKIAIGMIFLTVAIGVWVFFCHPSSGISFPVLALLPWLSIVIVARSGGLFRIDAQKNDPHPNLAVPFMIPGFVLMLLVITQIHLLEWKGTLVLSVITAAILGTAALKADSKMSSRAAGIIGIYLLSLPYGFGAVMEANAILDHSTPVIHPTAVLGMHETHGKSTSYHLTLAPWGPQQEEDDVTVPHRLYDSVAVGDKVCPVLRNGALNQHWYTVHLCPQSILQQQQEGSGE